MTSSHTAIQIDQAPSQDELAASISRLAETMGRKNTHTIYRRFGYLSNLVLLRKQRDLAYLECVAQYRFTPNDFVAASTVPDQRTSENEKAGVAATYERSSEDLMVEIDQTLTSYLELLKLARDVQNMDWPIKSTIQGTQGLLQREYPTLTEEQCFLQTHNDIVTLQNQEQEIPLDAGFDRLLHKLPVRITKPLFSTSDIPLPHGNFYFDSKKIHATLTFIIGLTMIVLSLVPVWILWYLMVVLKISTTSQLPISIILASNVLFFVIMALITRAKRHEVLTASAGYCAVLLVFLSNVSSS